MVGHLNPLVTEVGLAEVLDRLVDEQAPHLEPILITRRL